MKRKELRRLDRELSGFLDQLLGDLGKPAQRSAALYVLGLLLDGERKSIAPMAARLSDHEDEVEALRQRLQEAVVISTWSDDLVRKRLAVLIDRRLPDVEALVIDDTGFPKKGNHSVGVARQYSGTLGRIDNCQVAVSVHLAGESASACAQMKLYVPETWVSDQPRRRKAGIPEDLLLATKWQIAVQLLDQTLAAGVRKHVVLADAGYGDTFEFRESLVERGLEFVVGVNGVAVVWPPEAKPQLRRVASRRDGYERSQFVDKKHPAIAIKELAKNLTYRRVAWREGTKGTQAGRFAAVRVRPAPGYASGREPEEPLWLLVQWSDEENGPWKFWLSNLPATTSVRRLVWLAKLRWRVERDYQDLKGEVGLDHYEGRTWRGFHHHATLCSIAHAFLAIQKALSPPIDFAVDSAVSAPAIAARPA
jgi:SRSO17 transposase